MPPTKRPRTNFLTGVLHPKNHSNRSGFSMVEMIIVIIIVTIIYSFTAPQLSRYNSRKKLQLEAQKIASVLEITRSVATTRHMPVKFEVDAAEKAFYYLDATQTGKQFNLEKIYHLDSSLVFDPVPVPIVFLANGALQGTTAPVTVTIKGFQGNKVDIEVNPRTGRVTVGDIY